MDYCIKCNSIITTSYYKDRYENCCCSYHIDSEKSVGVCSECFKFVPVAGNKLADGRIICSECKKTAVSPDRPYDFMLKQVLGRMDQIGFTGLKFDDITIWTATSQEMAAFKKDSINVFNEGFCSYNNGRIKIYIQSHHTKIHFAGILAHELTHAWCFQNGLDHIPPQVAEGVCNLVCYYVYHTIDFPLARIYEKNLFDDTDPIYGDGFRAAYDFWKKHSWSDVINLLKVSNQS